MWILMSWLSWQMCSVWAVARHDYLKYGTSPEGWGFQRFVEKSGISAQQLPHKEIALEISNVRVKKISCDRTGMSWNCSELWRRTKFPVHQYMDRLRMTGEQKHKEINFTTVVCSKLLANTHTFHNVLDFTSAMNIIKTVQLIFLPLVYVPIQANFL